MFVYKYIFYTAEKLYVSSSFILSRIIQQQQQQKGKGSIPNNIAKLL